MRLQKLFYNVYNLCHKLCNDSAALFFHACAPLGYFFHACRYRLRIDAVLTIVDTLINNVPMLIDAALQLVTGLADGIIAALPVIIEKLPQIITSIINALVEGIPLILVSALAAPPPVLLPAPQ